MSSIRDQILSLPESDRLEHALFLLEDFYPVTSDRENHLRKHFSLSPNEVKILALLERRYPTPISPSAIVAYIQPHRHACSDENLTRVYISKIRKKTGIKIISYWGTGYTLSAPITDIPT